MGSFVKVFVEELVKHWKSTHQMKSRGNATIVVLQGVHLYASGAIVNSEATMNASAKMRGIVWSGYSLAVGCARAAPADESAELMRQVI